MKKCRPRNISEILPPTFCSYSYVKVGLAPGSHDSPWQRTGAMDRVHSELLLLHEVIVSVMTCQNRKMTCKVVRCLLLEAQRLRGRCSIQSYRGVFGATSRDLRHFINPINSRQLSCRRDYQPSVSVYAEISEFSWG